MKRLYLLLTASLLGISVLAQIDVDTSIAANDLQDANTFVQMSPTRTLFRGPFSVLK